MVVCNRVFRLYFLCLLPTSDLWTGVIRFCSNSHCLTTISINGKWLYTTSGAPRLRPLIKCIKLFVWKMPFCPQMPKLLSLGTFTIINVFYRLGILLAQYVFNFWHAIIITIKTITTMTKWSTMYHEGLKKHLFTVSTGPRL